MCRSIDFSLDFEYMQINLLPIKHFQANIGNGFLANYTTPRKIVATSAISRQ